MFTKNIQSWYLMYSWIFILVYDSNIFVLKTLGKLGVVLLVSYVFSLVLLEGKQMLSVRKFDRTQTYSVLILYGSIICIILYLIWIYNALFYGVGLIQGNWKKIDWFQS